MVIIGGGNPSLRNSLRIRIVNNCLIPEVTEIPTNINWYGHSCSATHDDILICSPESDAKSCFRLENLEVFSGNFQKIGIKL